jgi:hypothetical protein
MAFTDTPEISTHHVKALPIIGGQTVAGNVGPGTAETYTPVYQGQRFINCYPKRIILQNTDDKWVLTKCPAIVSQSKSFPSSGSDEITAVSSDGQYICKGKRIYFNDENPALDFTGSDNYTFRSMFQVTNPSGTDRLYAGILKNNTTNTLHSYQYNATTHTITVSNSLSFGNTTTTAPHQSLFYNGRLFLIGKDLRIYNTPPGQYTTWNSTDFIVPEARGDDLIAILLYKNYLVAFSTQSIEFFQDGAIELGSPLVRQEAYQQLYGVKLAKNITQSGDNIYFLSYEDRFGYGIYKIDNFVVKRISNFYVDSLINNESITGAQPFSTTLYMADFNGDPVMLFNCGFGSALYVDQGYVNSGYVGEPETVKGFPYICYSTKQNQWFDFVPSDSTGYLWGVEVKSPGFIQLAPTADNAQWKTYFVSSYSNNGTVNFYYLDKFYSGSANTTAEIVFDIADFGVGWQKHIKYIDVYGDFGNNTVNLAWTGKTDYSGWTVYYSKTQPQSLKHQALRWHNIGRYRYLAVRLKFMGASNIILDKVEVAYNLGMR